VIKFIFRNAGMTLTKNKGLSNVCYFLLLRLFLKINLIIIHRPAIIKTFFNQFLIAMNINVEVFIKLKHAFINTGLLFYGIF
jgi:hypothetical protein